MREAKLKRWQPKVWRPEYERIVALSAYGVSNVEIARKLGFTKEHVSNILNLPLSKERMGEFLEKIKDQNNTDVVGMGERIIKKTLVRLEGLLDNDDKFNESPFSIIDRGMRLAENILPASKGSERGTNVNVFTANGQTVVHAELKPEQQDTLLSALRKSHEVKLLREADKAEIKDSNAA